MSKELKKLAGNTVMESVYSTSAKKQLLNFILNEASDAQLKALILDGDIERLDEDAAQFVNKRFNLVKEEEFKDFVDVIREDLCDTIKEKNHEPEIQEEMITFILNEASNYQVLSMYFEGILPDETSNTEKESSLNEVAKKLMDNDTNLISEAGFAAGIIYQANQIAQRFKRNMTCVKADNPKECFRQLKINVTKKIITALKAGMSACSKDKNPEKCQMKIKKKIEFLNSKLG